MAALTSASVVAQSSCCSTSRKNLFFSSAVKERCTLFGRSTRLSSSAIWPIAAAVKAVDVSKVVPQADRVLIRLQELPEASVGGVLLPKSAVKFEHYLCGEVLSAGKEATGVSIGQKVLFSDLNAYEVNFGTNEKLCFCKAGELLACVD